MGRPLFLESFALEGDPDQPPAEAPVHPEYEAGFAAGHAQAMSEVDAAQNRINTGVIQALTDMEFSHSEAQSLILAQLAPLISSLSEKLLPSLADLSLAHHLAAHIIRAAEADLAGQIVVELPDPDQSELIAGLLEKVGRDLPIRFSQNKALRPSEATVRSDRGETTFDVERTLRSLQEILGAIISETTKETEDD